MNEEITRQKLEIAQKLADEVAHLNPRCLSLGAGMMAYLQELAKRFKELGET